MAELNDLLPSQIMIPSRDTLQPRGIIAVGNPKVIFKFAQEKVFYRFENNQCNSIIIMENTKLFNDYNTLVECQENIIEIEEIFYRFQDNTCITVNILESEKTVSDYYTLSECQENIVEIEETFYRFQDNTCIIVNILPSEKTVNDYITLVECQGNIIEGEGCGIINPGERDECCIQKGFDYWDEIEGDCKLKESDGTVNFITFIINWFKNLWGSIFG